MSVSADAVGKVVAVRFTGTGFLLNRGLFPALIVVIFSALAVMVLLDARRRRVLPAALGEAVGLRDVVDVDADHGFAEAAGGLGDDVGVVKERGGLDHGSGRAGRGCRT